MQFYEVVTWYQKKIGTYDKQQWEKTVEQKILNGFSSVALKNAKLKTELIDVDLVRGSTFHKAKPKQSLLTVIRLAILRYLFLPVYAQWWVHQTTPNAFGVLLFLYITQMINWAIYASNINTSDVASSIDSSVNTMYTNDSISNSFTKNIQTNVEEKSVSVAELLIPMALSLLLSLIHSQIVATNCAGLGIKSNHRRFSNTNTKEHRLPTRLRRRKKFVRIRGQDNNENAINETTQRKLNSYNIRINSDVETVERIKSEALSKITQNKSNKGIAEDELQANSFTSERNVTLIPITTTHTLRHSEASQEDDITELVDSIASHSKSQQDIQAFEEAGDSTKNTADFSTDSLTTNFNKKRNVNWHSPVHNYAIDIKENQQQTSLVSYTSNECPSSVQDNNASSSNIYYSRCAEQIEDPGVQEFFDSIIKKAITSASSSATNINLGHAICPTTSSKFRSPSLAQNEKRIVGEDDGFESLNGKSSSGEETNSSTQIAQAEKAVDENQTASEVKLRGASDDSRLRKRLGIMKAEENAAISKSIGPTGFSYRLSRSIKSESTDETDEETCDDTQTVINSDSITTNSPYNECTTSATEWLGVTTNSEECSCSSDLDNSDDYKKHSAAISDDNDGYDLDFTPTTILNPHGTPADRISCTIWDQHEAKKAQMSVLEISSAIIERVESMPETNDYIYIGIFFSITLSLVPTFYRLCEITIDSDNRNEISYFDLPMLLWEKASFSFMTIFHFAFGQTSWECAILIIGFIQRLCLTLMLFMIFAVAERSFKQRFLYGKLFSHLTSSRRAKKSNLPHFRLNKVRNIKTWLSVRSYLKKRGPQRSVDIIVSAAFIVTLFLIAFLSVEWLKDSSHLHSHLNLEALMWSTAIGIFVLRFMTLGNKIHHKYRSVSVLITEQINLYLQIEQKPKKKEELMVSNSVLKLAADLLKELESPFKISGLSANPYLFTTIKVVILSALSGMLSEMLGFKLKLHKIKIK